MKHLKLFEGGWKSPGYEKVDNENKQLFDDVLIDLKDLGVTHVEVSADSHLNEQYNINYTYESKLNGIITPGSKIEEAKRRLEDFNQVMLASYDLLERITSMGYKIAYFQLHQITQ